MTLDDAGPIPNNELETRAFVSGSLKSCWIHRISRFPCANWPMTVAVSAKAVELGSVLLTTVVDMAVSIRSWSAAESLCGVLRFSAWPMDLMLYFG